MTDPFTIATTAFSVLGSIQQARAQEAQLEAQAQAAAFNQRVAEQNAEIVRQQTDANIERQDRERRLRAGQARAQMGASGISGGSFLDILQSSAAQEELDLLTLENEGFLRQRDFSTQADLLGAQAENARGQARQSVAAGIMGGVSSGLGVLERRGVFDRR